MPIFPKSRILVLNDYFVRFRTFHQKSEFWFFLLIFLVFFGFYNFLNFHVFREFTEILIICHVIVLKSRTIPVILA